MKFAFLKIRQLVERVERNPKDQEAAQTAAEWREQFAE
jgi:hypothetical protein